MKQAQFITLMSQSLGVEEKTIRMIVRTLREAGLFTTGARGVNAPDITLLDAVRVVIAVVASPSPGRAARDVRYFSTLKPDMRDEETNFMKPRLLSEDATLEQTLLDCVENRFPYEAIANGYVQLAERGSALIHIGNGWQEYHHREQWAAVTAEYSASNDKPRNRAVLDAWEVSHRIANTKVNRSAEFPLDALRQIGIEMIGWGD